MHARTHQFVRAGRAALLAWFAIGAGQAGAADYRLQAAPAWVRPVAVAADAPVGKAVGGVEYLLVDQQVRVGSGNERQAYAHHARRVVTDKGLSEVGSFSFDFDPSYQTLSLHSLDVLRDGKRSSRLGHARIKVLQRESDLAQRVYDGSKTVSIDVEDLRVGDVLEWSYTRTGWNPVFKNRQHGYFDLQWSAPVTRQQARLLLPPERRFAFKLQRSSLQAQQAEFEGLREYLWSQQNLQALHREAESPRWFDPYPFVEWSEYGSWAEVAQWAEPLYTPPAVLDPALQQVVQRLSLPKPADRMLATLRLVQQQVRYLSVSIGPGSHAPRAPAEVLRQRFGDCKDKALLTVTLLRALGIEASVALVNTRLRQQLAGRLPSPGSFDHAIVRARLGTTDYWLDPTLAPQQARLEKLSQADHGQALVLDGQSPSLVTMPESAGRLNKRVVHMLFDSTAGLDQPTVYRVRTVYHAAAADEQRAALADDDGEALQREYLNYYARLYPGIEIAAPMEVHDNVSANLISVTEHYRIKQQWSAGETPGRDEASLHAPEMRAALRKPESRIRTGPLAVAHPVELDVVLEQRLPPEHPRHGRSAEFRLEDPHFEYEKTVSYEGEKVEIAHYYRSLKDHAEPAQLGAYLDKLGRAYDSVGLDLVLGGTEVPEPEAKPREPLQLDSGPLALLGVIAGLGLALVGLTARQLHRAMQGGGAADPAPAQRWTLGLLGLTSLSVICLSLLLQTESGKGWLLLPPSMGAGIVVALISAWAWRWRSPLRAPASAETPGSPPQP